MILTQPTVSPYAYAGFVGQGIGNKISVKSTAPEKVMQHIAEKVCEYYDLSMEQLKEKCRKRYALNARQVAMYMMRSKGITFMAIADFFAKDHTTCIWSCDSVQDHIDTDETYRREVTGVKVFISGN